MGTGIFLFNHCSLVHFAVDVPSKIFFYTAIITPEVDTFFSAGFYAILFILAGTYDMHESSDDFEFRPARTTELAALGSLKKIPIGLLCDKRCHIVNIYTHGKKLGNTSGFTRVNFGLYFSRI